MVYLLKLCWHELQIFEINCRKNGWAEVNKDILTIFSCDDLYLPEAL